MHSIPCFGPGTESYKVPVSYNGDMGQLYATTQVPFPHPNDIHLSKKDFLVSGSMQCLYFLDDSMRLFYASLSRSHRASRMYYARLQM